MNQRPSGYEPDELPLLHPALITYLLFVRTVTIYLSIVIMEEVEGFEPPRGLTRLSVFKTDPFSQTWVYLRDIIVINGGPYRTRTCDRTVMSRLL